MSNEDMVIQAASKEEAEAIAIKILADQGIQAEPDPLEGLRQVGADYFYTPGEIMVSGTLDYCRTMVAVLKGQIERGEVQEVTDIVYQLIGEEGKPSVVLERTEQQYKAALEDERIPIGVRNGILDYLKKKRKKDRDDMRPRQNFDLYGYAHNSRVEVRQGQLIERVVSLKRENQVRLPGESGRQFKKRKKAAFRHFREANRQRVAQLQEAVIVDDKPASNPSEVKIT